MPDNKHRKRRGHRGVGASSRERQLFVRKCAPAAVAVLAAVAAALLIGRAIAGPVMNRQEAQNIPETELVIPQTESETQETDGSETENASEPSVAADVAAIDDAEDPQSEDGVNGTGAPVDVETLQEQEAAEQRQTGGITYGIDVAKYQDVIDWAQVKEAGVQFAMIRAGYRTSTSGVICEDPLAKYNMQEAQAEGIMLGAYFFSTAVNEEEAREEAAWLTEFIAKYKITYPVAFNCENFQSQESRQYGLTKEERTANAVAFLDAVAEKGYTPMFYAAKNEMEGNAQWDMSLLSSKYQVWVSRYPALPYPQTASSGYTGSHAMWQHTNQGIVPGIAGGVDLDVAYFGYEQEAQAKDTSGAEVVAATPEANIRFTEVNETVTAKIETNLRTVPSSASADTIAAKLVNGDTATRTGIGHNGWSRVIYGDKTYYAVSGYLTTDLSYQGVAAPTAAPAAPQDGTGAQEQQPATQEQPVSGGEQTNQGAGDAAAGQTAGEGGAVQGAADSIYRTVSEQITAKDTTNLRSAPDKSDTGNVVAVIHAGEVYTRTAIGTNGWSKIDYNGQTVYAVSGYITTKLNYQETGRPTPENPDGNAIFTPVNEQVTAKDVTNLRTLPSTESADTVAAVLHNGEYVTRIATGSNGWSKVDYNGQTLYAITSYLVTQ